jgi:hypothetical protein
MSTTTTNKPTKYRAWCNCGWHGRAYRDGNAAWGSLANHNEKCRGFGSQDIEEVK